MLRAIIAGVMLASASIANANFIEFQPTDFGAYGDPTQPTSFYNVAVTGNVGDPNGQTVTLSGNTWADLQYNVTVTEKTVLSFDVLIDQLGEIHGIGLDNDNVQSETTTFQLAGTQTWGINDFNINPLTLDEWYSIEIKLGQYSAFLGKTFDRITFINDHDVSKPFAKTSFRALAIQVSNPSVLGMILVALGGLLYSRRTK